MGKFGAVRKHPDYRAWQKFLRRNRTDKAAKAVMAADPDQFAAQPVGNGFRRELVIDVHRDPDPTPPEIAVVGPPEHRPAEQAVERADCIEGLWLTVAL